MRYIIITSLALLFVASTPYANASTASQALVRMDAIIKEMQILRAEFAQLASAPSAPTVQHPAVFGAQSKTFFTQSLEFGETNSDIKKIQKLLATDPEIYPYGVASGLFGPKTEEGIKNFQTRFDLDPVGVVGPATKTLFELFFAAYPDDVYPSDVLKKKPTVLGITTSEVIPPVPTAPVPQQNTGTVNPALSITAYFEDNEADVRIKYKNGTSKILLIDGKDEEEVIDGILEKTTLKREHITALMKFTDAGSSRNSDDEEGAQDAIDDAQDAIDEVENDIDDADADVDTNHAEDSLDDAKDLLNDAEDAFDEEEYEDALDLAEEAMDMADEAADELDDAS